MISAEHQQHTLIEATELTKKFDNVTAVDKISFTVSQGELFGFLGPNGAGKTTTIGILTGLVRPDSGTIRINGLDCTRNPKAAQHLIGVVPDESNLYPELSGFDNLCFCAALYGMPRLERQTRARELLDIFGLTEAAGRKFAGYSRGMKRKLTIAAGVIHRPAILFLDEPTTGVDVISARQIRHMIAELHRGNHRLSYHALYRRSRKNVRADCFHRARTNCKNRQRRKPSATGAGEEDHVGFRLKLDK